MLLARQGAKVALVDNNPEWAQGTKDMIDHEGGVSKVVQADATDEESCRQAVAKTVELFGSVSILVNIGMHRSIWGQRAPLTCIAVGVGGAMGDATKLDLEAWDRDMRINVTSMVLMARHTIPEMVRFEFPCHRGRRD